MSQTVSIVVSAQSPSNAIRSHNHPVLESGNLSFPFGQYGVDFTSRDDRCSFSLKHWIKDAPLVSRLLKEGRAEYACTVASPVSSYRDVHVSSEAKHEIRWDLKDLGEPPLFTPMVVCVSPCQLILGKDRDGVHDMWDGLHINLEPGSRLALGSVIQLKSSIRHMLSLRQDDTLEDGSFQVGAEMEPFCFIVKLSPNLYRCLRFQEDRTQKNIMTHIVTACLARLQRDFSKENDEENDGGGWRAYRGLVAFSELLDSKGLPHWTDQDNFYPERVATALYPHQLPPEDEENSP